MPNKNVYFYGGLNTDDEDRLLPEGDYRHAVNFRGNEAGEANKGALESITGNELVANVALDETQTVIGSAKWVERNSIVYFVFSGDTVETPHSIWLYDITAQTHTLILSDNILNFQLAYKIVHANVVNNVLYWTDGYFEDYLENADGYVQFNPPRMLDIDKAIAGDYTVVDIALLDMIKAPMAKASDVAYADSGNESNLLYGSVYQFAVQWVYDNDNESVWNVTSKLPIPVKWDYIQGRNFLEPEAENTLAVSVDTGSEQVKILRVAVRTGNNNDFEVFREIDKALEGIADNDVITVNYDGTLTGTAIPLSQGIRGFDRVPQVASCQEVLSSKQMAYSDIVEGYDGVELVTTEMGYYTTEIPYQVWGRNQMKYQKDEVVVPAVSPLKIFNIAPLQYFGYVEGDVLVFQLPTAFNATTNSGINDITIAYTVTQEDIDNVQGLSTANQLLYMVNTVGEYVSDELAALGFPNTFTPTVSVAIACEIDFSSSNIIYGLDTARRVTNFAKCAPVKTLKTGVIHEFGIQYYDRAMRSGGVLENEAMKLFVPFPTNEPSTVDFLDPASPYFINPYVTGSHTPPTWARYYQLVWKKTRIADFQQRTGINITTIPTVGLLKISLDTYYESQYGAKINHTIQVGDIVRIKNQKSENITDLETGLPSYATEYKEVQVQRYEEAGGVNGAEAIYVQLFDYNTVCNGTESFVLEIYSARQENLDSVYYEIGEVYDILDPYTEDRRHGGQIYTGGVITSPSVGGDTFVVEGDVRPAIVFMELGTDVDIVFTPSVGSPFTTMVSSVVYNYATNESTIVTATVSDGTTYLSYSFDTGSTAVGRTFVVVLNFGDVYLRPRITNRYDQALQGNFDWRYWVEDPHISDYYVSNSIDIGKPAIIDRLGGRKRLIASGIHGGAYVDNTNQNNFCSFDFNPLNKFDLDESFGRITRTIMNGYTLKVLQERKETSIYIQRTQALQGDGNSTVSYTDRTFGGINPYESLYGTIHPASVKVIEGALYYYDYYSSKFIRSLTNGQQELNEGKYKVNAYVVNLTDTIRANGVENFEIIANIDEQNREYQCFFSGVVDEEPYNTGIAFSINDDRWKSLLSYLPTWCETLGNTNVMFKEAQLYLANQGVNLEFFGVDEESSVKYLLNEAPDFVKQPLSHGVRCYPKFTEIAVSIKPFGSYNGMLTTMEANLFTLRENGYWAQYGRDETDPTKGSVELARINGRTLRGYYLAHELKYSGTDKFVLFSAVVNYIPSPSTI